MYEILNVLQKNKKFLNECNVKKSRFNIFINHNTGLFELSFVFNRYFPQQKEYNKERRDPRDFFPAIKKGNLKVMEFGEDEVIRLTLNVLKHYQSFFCPVFIDTSEDKYNITRRGELVPLEEFFSSRIEFKSGRFYVNNYNTDILPSVLRLYFNYLLEEGDQLDIDFLSRNRDKDFVLSDNREIPENEKLKINRWFSGQLSDH